MVQTRPVLLILKEAEMVSLKHNKVLKGLDRMCVELTFPVAGDLAPVSHFQNKGSAIRAGIKTFLCTEGSEFVSLLGCSGSVIKYVHNRLYTILDIK